jgi:hypothetical protein
MTMRKEPKQTSQSKDSAHPNNSIRIMWIGNKEEDETNSNQKCIYVIPSINKKILRTNRYYSQY